MSSGGLTSIDGFDCYRIDRVDEMEPFLTTVVSDVDLWMFVSSTGPLTAGRIDADHALFPYVTDDQIHRSVGQVGPTTVLARTVEGRRELWRPFSAESTPGCRRALAKSVLGDRLVFEEVNDEWQVRFRATWAPSSEFGWVRTVEIADLADGSELEVLDGVLDVMPAGVDAVTEQTRSNLVDAYKRSEVSAAADRVAIYNLESLITDRAEPREALTATVVWSWGFTGASLDLDARAKARFVSGRGADSAAQHLVTGRPGAYLLSGTVDLAAGASDSWSIVMDTDLDHADVVAVTRAVDDPATPERVLADLDAGSTRLCNLLAGADADQHTADAVADAHHRSNVLFNSMRGGVFPYDHLVPTADLDEFIRLRNRNVAERSGDRLHGLGAWAHVAEVRAAALDAGDDDLTRLVLEYLPLTFSRRHGDPSRPWNHFSINVRDGDGNEMLRYEGNWRDIFQNWDALLHSYPAYYAHMVAKFVNASTLDGYNPYRISREGVDWEVPDPYDPWVNIGYWGDHQIAYLLRLVEGWEQFEPGAITDWLDRPVFVYADVPYRIAGRKQMIRDPRNTISYQPDRAAAVEAREQEIGTDGRLVVDVSGDLLRVGLAEKLLVPALSKLSNFVPGGGIWMNTQRPEWNDANNALAGPGLSMVTVYYLRRYLTFVRDLLADRESVSLSSAVAEWLDELAAVYGQHPLETADAAQRRTLVEALGPVADTHGRRMLSGVDSRRVAVSMSDVVGLLDDAVEHLDATIRTARRADDLFASYNLISFPSERSAEVDPLGPMLEGQVAVLSSGALDAADSVRVIDALFASDMYQSELGTFLLYPPTDLGPFSERNIIPEPVSSLGDATTLRQIVTIDQNGRARFRPGAVNGEALGQLLSSAGVSADDRTAVEQAYEEVFHHASFTGRSGSMHGYEGIGSVYWHMVAKLLLAVQEAYFSAVESGADGHVIDELAVRYRRIRSGLGFTKTPEVFGAFPLDCYSHTPSHSGAQQPGMTGQVKEEVLTRLGELGIVVRDGIVHLRPGLLPLSELIDPASDDPTVFTFCSVPMTIRLGESEGVAIVTEDGRDIERAGLALTADESSAVFARTGEIARVDWTIRPG